MAIKIDLEKAYDRLRLDFIEESLLASGFNGNLVVRIMSYINSANMSIVWNGERTVLFGIMSRGIRQGDSISPYLFVICMER